ncbi:MAG: UbiD family decarboxylase, partial [Syntrophales bacterium]|nr:UbiD family decarboxylase [Syntrophales bacterium]
HNERHMGGLIIPTQDIGRIKAKYDRDKKPMPFASVIGPDPLSAIASSVAYGVNADEADLAGAIRQKPVELVKCKTVDLEVPAHAEIILEGEVLHDVIVDEGPFGEYSGYRSTPRLPRSVYKVNCITHRNDPILVMSNMGVPPDDGQITYACTGVRTAALRALQEQGIPVTGVYVPPEGVGHLVIVAVKKTYNNIATQIAQVVFGTSGSPMFAHQLIVVDDDVDPYNLAEVLHAVATKCHPINGVITYPAWGHPLAPYLSLHERTWGKGGKLVLDCTWPLDWDRENEVPMKSSFKTIYSQEIQDTVLKNWKEYGFKND